MSLQIKGINNENFKTYYRLDKSSLFPEYDKLIESLWNKYGRIFDLDYIAQEVANEINYQIGEGIEIVWIQECFKERTR